VAVRAQEEQILEPVIETIPVDVMELKRQRLSAPLPQPTPLAELLLQTCAEQPELDVVASPFPTSAEHILDRLEPRAGRDYIAANGVPPRVATNPNTRMHSVIEYPAL